jgi:2-polyprenyl-6-methoxyphenol hydroxylase-like FAD-dependent oxidoreductase
VGVERILIVGGGIAGLSLSRALRDGPWQVHLVEREAGPARLGTGLAVQPNAMRVLTELGAGAEVARAGTVLHRFQYLDRDGAVLCDVDLDAFWNGLGPFVGITRAALRSALVRDVDRSGLGRAVRCVEEHGDHVSVRFTDGAVAGYDLVVGADGLHSAVRRSLDDRAVPAFAGQLVWRSVAAVRPDLPDGVQFWLGDDRFFGLCPAGEGWAYGFGTVRAQRRREPVAGRARALAARFEGFGAPVRDYLDAVGGDAAIHCAPIEWLPDVSWGTDRVVLIGDAAHAMSPMMGQGGCLAIEDALVLAEELRRGDDLRSALQSFRDRRRPRVDWVARQSRALAELVALPADVRDPALRQGGVTAFHDRYRPLLARP